MNTSGLARHDRRPFLSLLFAASMGCAQRPDMGAPAGASAVAGSSAGAVTAPTPSSRRAPGENPFGLPAASISARAGDFALVPSRGSLNQAYEQPESSRSLLYSGAIIERPGERESGVTWPTGQRGSVANSLLIAFPRAARAAQGDIVLTSSTSNSGFLRAIVVSAGESESPRVRQLDLPLEPAAVAAEPESTLRPNTFRVLREAGEPGSTLACRREKRSERFVLVTAAGERRLGLGFAGRALLLDASSCRALPLVPRVQPGSHAFIPVAGEFIPAEVSRVDTLNGRVIVKYEFAAESHEMAVGYTNVASELPP
jgi:hypothetical protein